jgi:uncharacterized protein with PIN domain
MRFIIDTMLGNLVTWLRLLGFDTVYIKSRDDEEIILRALSEARVLVTRDKELAARSAKKGVVTVLLDPADTTTSLKVVAKMLGVRLGFDESRTRCPVCNEQLVKTSQNPVRWRCPSCGKQYWKGRHWRNIGKVLAELGES